MIRVKFNHRDAARLQEFYKEMWSPCESVVGPAYIFVINILATLLLFLMFVLLPADSGLGHIGLAINWSIYFLFLWGSLFRWIILWILCPYINFAIARNNFATEILDQIEDLKGHNTLKDEIRKTISNVLLERNDFTKEEKDNLKKAVSLMKERNTADYSAGLVAVINSYDQI